MATSRTYPLTPDCKALTADKASATTYHNRPVHIISTRLPGEFQNFSDAQDNAQDHPTFKTFLETLERDQNAENERRESRGLPPVYRSIKDPWDTNVFEVVPLKDKCVLYVNHWHPAPLYPAANTFEDLMRRKTFFPDIRSVVDRYGVCDGLKTIKLEPNHPYYKRILRKYEKQDAMSLKEDVIYLKLFQLPPTLPVLRGIGDFKPGRHDFAVSERDAERVSGGPVVRSSKMLTKQWKRRATAEKNHSALHTESWARLKQGPDGLWGTEIDFWEIDQDSLSLTLHERSDLQSRLSRPLTSQVEQDELSFGLFENIDLSLHPVQPDGEEGSGIPMGA